MNLSTESNPSVTYDSERDPAASQMSDYLRGQQGLPRERITSEDGAPVASIYNVRTVGPRGPMLITDTFYLEEQAHFNRERIPERVVHAKGAGAFGYFEVTSTEITKYTSAKLFNKIGKRTPLAIRFSNVARERGAADTVRDIRGFALKFYTEQGNWDLVGNNTPIFFIRDPYNFIRFIHSQKRNPSTNLIDQNARWDFWTSRPETLFQVTWLYADVGIPDGYRKMNGYGSHTYKLVNNDNQAFYTKFHWHVEGGPVNLDQAVANRLQSSDPDYYVHDLYDAIARGEFPTWRFSVQIMTFDQARTWEFNPFDLTKIWPEKDYPLIEVGKLVLNRNPTNYFAEIEQLSFNTANRIRGIEYSPDKVLQARAFAYGDAARYRLGVNHHQIPVNRAICSVLTPTQRDGAMCTSGNYGSMPNYIPCSFNPNVFVDDEHFNERPEMLQPPTDVDRYESEFEDNYTQVRDYFQSMSRSEQARLYNNIADDLGICEDFIQTRALKEFAKINPEYEQGVRNSLFTQRVN